MSNVHGVQIFRTDSAGNSLETIKIGPKLMKTLAALQENASQQIFFEEPSFFEGDPRRLFNPPDNYWRSYVES
jgi:hypothetical protein